MSKQRFVCLGSVIGMAGGWAVALAWLAALLLGSGTAHAQPTAEAGKPAVQAVYDEARFGADLRELTKRPHRLAGSAFGREAGDYILKRLDALGVETLTLDLPLYQTETKYCQLQVGDVKLPIQAMRPNVVVPPSTSGQGLTTRMIYVGRGELADYGNRNPEGAIVVMEYECQSNWERAFSLGASAVLFLGDEADTDVYRKFTPVPVNLLRFYVAKNQTGGLDLTRDYENVRLLSNVGWNPGIGRDIVVYLPGRKPLLETKLINKPEMIVLSANYDSFGEVPEACPSARGAANTAALLQAVEFFKDNRPNRDMLIVFLDNQARYHQGARYLYDALMMKQEESDKISAKHVEESQALKGMLTALDNFQIDAWQKSSHVSWQSRMLWVVLVVGVVTAVMGLFALLWKHLNHAIAIGFLTLTSTTILTVVLFFVYFADRTGATATATDTASRLRLVMEKQAEFLRADLNQTLLEERLMRNRASNPKKLEELKNHIDQVTAIVMQWDNVRRYIREGSKSNDIKKEIFEQLMHQTVAATRKRLARHLEEVEAQIVMDAQRDALIHKMMGTVKAAEAAAAAAAPEAKTTEPTERWISLHATYNFSDVGPLWNIGLIDWTEKAFIATPPGDNPGMYNRILSAFRAASKALPSEAGLATEALLSNMQASQHIPGKYVAGGSVAGTCAIYNVCFMTSFDRRVREGHPSDNLANLDWRRIMIQAAWANRLLQIAADAEGDSSLSVTRQLQAQNMSKRPLWNGTDRTEGDGAKLQVTGSLSEDRPASGAVVAVIPRALNPQTGDWNWINAPANLSGFDPFYLEQADNNGMISSLTINKLFITATACVGSVFDENGEVWAITNAATVKQGSITNGVMRFDLFPSRNGVLVYRPVTPPAGGTLRVLSAATDSPYPPARGLYGQLGDTNFFYVTALLPPEPMKFFQLNGPILLGMDKNDAQHTYGRGRAVEKYKTPPAISTVAAKDLYDLNEVRLNMLRKRGVTDAAIESLHSRAKQALDAAGADKSVLERESHLKQSLALSTAVYSPLRQSMDDLVYAIVVLLLLAIPFAFAMERLLFAATTIYQRLSGFAGIFMLTFALLYFMHPGFAIASTPIIIFLAFTILLLSILVIFIIVRKFRTELKAMQGQGVGVHQLEISRLGTLLAAVNMGMSTMRRRPTRTLLTAVTVVMLTFTILCFASVSSQMGVRRITQGPVNEETPVSMMVRHLNYRGLPPELLTQLRGYEGRTGMIADQWWLVRASQTEDPYSIARVDNGKALWLDGMLGLNPRELERWPAMAGVLSGDNLAQKIKLLQQGGVYLPAIVQDRLSLKPGDAILFNGQKAVFAGVTDSTNFQRLAHLDGRPALPVDMIDANQSVEVSQLQQGQSDLVERDFVHLSPDQLAIASSDLVRDFGGDMRIINIYADKQADALALGRQIAEMVSVPVWSAGAQGVERMVFTRLTEVSGGMSLVIPIVLGGLIIFGTLLGSISDREREIYTFSALGLAPRHVGFLFFAEASVYAVVGGMAGQILAQTVALGASQLAAMGVIKAPSINYSSTNSLFAIGLVMATVLISAIYPAMRASKSANPGLARSWKMPKPENDQIQMTFPFTVSAYDITGVVSFLAEHFKAHNDAGLGSFAASEVGISREAATGNLRLSARLALAPFDLGVTQEFALTARPSEIPGVDEVAIWVKRSSGASGDWVRANRVFVQELRGQFLLWRTLSADVIEQYRMETLQTLGENKQATPPQE